MKKYIKSNSKDSGLSKLQFEDLVCMLEETYLGARLARLTVASVMNDVEKETGVPQDWCDYAPDWAVALCLDNI